MGTGRGRFWLKCDMFGCQLTRGRLVKVNIDHQVDRIYNHLGDQALGMSIREFLDWIT